MALTCTEAARFLECSAKHVAYLCETNALPAIKIKGQWLINNEDLTQYLLKKAHSVKSVALHHGVHPETVRRWLREGKVLGIKDGQWLVENPILKPIKSHKKKPPK
jgi:excisionase family DNA binding protein